jgi:hypothetical protein
MLIANKPIEIWAMDGIRADTVQVGMAWGFFFVEHWNAECTGCHVCKKGHAQEAVELRKQEVRKIYGATGRGVALGLTLREGHGAQYTSEQYLSQLRFWKRNISYGFVQKPQNKMNCRTV